MLVSIRSAVLTRNVHRGILSEMQVSVPRDSDSVVWELVPGICIFVKYPPQGIPAW